MYEVKQYIRELKNKYNINANYYPNMTFGIDGPDLDYEVYNIVQYLNKMDIKVNTKKIYLLLTAKKNCMINCANESFKILTKQYDNNVLKINRPVGAFGPLEYFFATSVLMFTIFLFKYAEGFGLESGKITARKLLDNEKTQVKDLMNASTEEIEFLEHSFIILNEDKNMIELIRKIKQIIHKKE